MSEEYDLSRAFERIENYLIDSMMRNFKHHRAEETVEGYNWEQWQAKQLEALEEYRRNNKEKFSTEFAELNDRVGEMLRNTADDAGYRQEQKILKAIQKGFTPSRPSSAMQASFFKLNERKMNALVRSTTDDLGRAEFAVLRRSNDAYRKAIFSAQTFMNSGAATYEQAVDMATKDMLSAGLQCVEYSNGARHTLHDYAEMAIRTANKRAYLRGEGMKMQEWGITTVIINRRHGACGRCADFVGMVFIDDVYAGGKPSDHGGKYPLLSDAMKSGLFHPRCKDSSSLYIEGISTSPDQEVLPKKAQEDLTEIERAEQKATYGKRMEKMNKRLSKYALDPDNKKMYRSRAEQWAEYTEKWQSYHEKQLAKAIKSGIMIKTIAKLSNSGVNISVKHIGKLDKDIYKCITDDITTDEVIITDTQIAHIKEKHPNDYEQYYQYIAEIISKPDYILEANKPNTAFVLKHIEDNDKRYQVILRLHTSDDPKEYKNSVITFLKVSEKRYNRYLRTKKILYKAE
ncbi:phage minor capsid protein [Ruminococcus difficilis]|nr:phage minor capsid protein [Ruminococcus difficilis]